MKRKQARIQRLWTKPAYGLWLIERDSAARVSHFARPTKLVFEQVRGEAMLLPDPTIEIPETEALDWFAAINLALVESGIQLPREHETAKEIAALREHLADTRSVRDRLLGMAERGL